MLRCAQHAVGRNNFCVAPISTAAAMDRMICGANQTDQHRLSVTWDDLGGSTQKPRPAQGASR